MHAHSRTQTAVGSEVNDRTSRVFSEALILQQASIGVNIESSKVSSDLPEIGMFLNKIQIQHKYR